MLPLQDARHTQPVLSMRMYLDPMHWKRDHCMYSIEVCTSSGGINTFLPGWQLSFGEQAGEISYRDTFASHPGLLWMYADMNNPFKVPPPFARRISPDGGSLVTRSGRPEWVRPGRMFDPIPADTRARKRGGKQSFPNLAPSFRWCTEEGSKEMRGKVGARNAR